VTVTVTPIVGSERDRSVDRCDVSTIATSGTSPGREGHNESHCDLEALPAHAKGGQKHLGARHGIYHAPPRAEDALMR
jgi:hypothetical protein